MPSIDTTPLLYAGSIGPAVRRIVSYTTCNGCCRACAICLQTSYSGTMRSVPSRPHTFLALITIPNADVTSTDSRAQNSASNLVKPHPQGSGFRQKARNHRLTLLGRAKHMHPRAGPTLFHLHRHPENIQSAVREQGLHQIAEDFRIHIVDAGFHHHQRFGGLGATAGIHQCTGKRSAHHHAQQVGPTLHLAREPAP
jgi:hypothetical protein